MLFDCALCGFVYDENQTPLELGYPSGTGFFDLPDDWHCPLCGADKSEFCME